MEGRRPKRDAEYKEATKINMVPISDFAKYGKLLPEVRNSLCLLAAPAMACVTKVGVNVNISGDARATQECPESLIQHHQDNMQSVGYVSAAYFALVHKAVPRNKVKYIKGAQEAVDKEYNKLNDRPFVDWSSVREKRHVRDDAKAAWHGKYTEPVVILRRNLCGHPLASLS